MKHFKQIFSLVLALAILMSAVPFSAIVVSAEEEYQDSALNEVDGETVAENSVESIEVISGEIAPLVENAYGYWYEWYNEMTEQHEEFFVYYTPALSNLMVQINYSDGTSTTAHVGESVDGYGVDYFTSQFENPWVIGGDNYITITYMGKITRLPVTIIENPVESIEIVSGEIAPIMENMNGYWEERYNEETGENEKFFRYALPELDNIMVKINYTDGTSTTAHVFDDVDGDYHVDSTHDQYTNPWTVGENNYFIIEYLGVTTQVPVTIIENPVESIEVVSGEITLVENCDGHWSEWYNEESGELEEFFYYDEWGTSGIMVQINYKDGGSTTANIWDEVDGYKVEWDLYNDQYTNPWTVGIDNYLTIEYMGATTQLPVTIIENPVESIEVVSGEIEPLVEHANGFWTEWYNEETGQYEEYFYYHVPDLSNIMVQINYTDGTSTIAGAYDEVDGYWFGMSGDFDQYPNPWVIGGDNYLTIEYLGATAQLPVTLVENPVASIEVVSGEIAPLMENYKGNWSERYNEETGEYEKYFDYDTPNYSNIMLQINYTDGTSTTADVYDEVDGHWFECYANQYDSPWVVGSDNYFTIEYLGATTQLPVTIVENPVESIEIVSGEITLVENCDGYWDDRYNEETGEYEEYFHYYTSRPSNIIVQINYTDGTSTTAGLDDNVEGYWFEESDYYAQRTNPWVIGGDNYLTIEYLGATTQLPVTIVENPVESIEINTVPTKEYVYGDVSTGNLYCEEYYFHPEDLTGLVFTVYYTDGSSKIYTHNDIGNDGLIDGHEYTLSYDALNPELGNFPVTFGYMGAEAEYTVVLKESPVAAMEIIKGPTKSYSTAYYPVFDGMEILITYTDNTSKIVTVTEENTTYTALEGWAWLPFDVGIEVDGYLMRIGQDWDSGEACCAYLGQVCVFDREAFTYEANEIASVDFSNVSWNGDGMIVNITYTDGTAETIVLNNMLFSLGSQENNFWGFCAKTESGIVQCHIVTYLDANAQVDSYLVWIFEEEFLVDALQLEQSGVIIDTTIGTLDSSTELYVKEQDISNIVVTDNGDYNLDTAVTYDIYFKKGDEIVQPDGTVTVSLPVPADMNGEKCKVFHIDEDGNLIDMNAQYIDGYMVFETDHFSYYTIMEKIGGTLIGDVNSDGTIDARDITFLRRYYVGWDVTIDEVAADVNADNVIDARDITILRRYYVGWDIELG